MEVMHYQESGYKASQIKWVLDFPSVCTFWNLDGSVHSQARMHFASLDELAEEGIDSELRVEVREVKESPPWWWGVTDQTVPSIPQRVRDDETTYGLSPAQWRKWVKTKEARRASQ